MPYNLLENIDYCANFVSEISSLLTYSHLLPLTVVLLFGTFVLFKTNFRKLSVILFSISIVFSIWCILNLLIWFGYADSNLLMSAWAPIEVFSISLFILCLYFIYLYIRQSEPPLLYKIVWGILLLPVAILPAFGHYLLGYDIQECVAVESSTYLTYVSAIKLALIIWIIFELVTNIPKDKVARMRNFLLAIGILVFVLSFYFAGYVSEQTGDYRIELYGLYGMIVFISILSYLVVKYSLFNIRLIAAQALVTTLAVLVGSQFYFIRNTTNIYLNSATLILVLVFGSYLVKNVKREIESRELIEQQKVLLEKANVRLKELDKQKTEFVSLASHQLRAPMTAIKGYATLILDGDYGQVPEPLKEPIQHIFTSTQSLIQIVGDFLDVTRIELGTMKFTYSDFDLKQLVNDVIGELQPNINISKLEFKFNSTEEPMPMHGDAAKIKQVLNNLIDNSIKYTKQGWVHVSLEKAGDIYRFKVQDTGVGIAQETIPKLFDKFIRAGNANDANVIGTGLGLFVAKQMIQKHNGKIWAESEGEGKGSTFIVEIPAKA